MSAHKQAGPEKEFYFTIQNTATAEFKDRGSRFIAYAYPVADIQDCKRYLSILKEEHPKAAHHCFAYRLGLTGDIFRSSDDGEPSGTAGRPILGQIDAKELTNVMIIVVRYFGGTLLGVPGLIAAYKTVSSLVLQLTPVEKKVVTIPIKITFDYTQMNEVMRRIKQLDAEITRQDMQLFCTIECSIAKNKLSDMTYYFSELKNVEIAQL